MTTLMPDNFETVSPTEAEAKVLDQLTAEAQELGMGY